MYSPQEQEKNESELTVSSTNNNSVDWVLWVETVLWEWAANKWVGILVSAKHYTGASSNNYYSAQESEFQTRE